jgi:negative regulator of sigma E activity
VITQEQLSAYLDGETTATEAQAIEAALEADAALRARLDRLQHNDLEVRAAMDSLLERPVPDRLAETIRASMAARTPQPLNDNAASPTPRRGWAARAIWPSAIAAALVGGVMIGQLAPVGGLRSGEADWTSASGAPQAGRTMALALSTATSGAHVTLAANRTMTPVMTFASRDGGLCRQFEVSGAAGGQNGLACRDAGKPWRLVALVAAPKASDGGYRTAGGPGGDAVSSVADRLIQGEPMDAAAEAAALRSR